MRRLALSLVAACTALCGADPAALVRQVAGYDYGKDPTAVRELESLVMRSAGSSDAAALEGLLVAGLASARTLGAKDALCRDLALVGGDAAVPSLGAMLAAPETAEMARYALERIPGERSAAALREALGRTSGTVKIGIVNSLGRRRDGTSVEGLKALQGSPDARLAGAAAEALGGIGNRAAREALMRAPPSLANAYALLRIAEQAGTDGSAIYRRLASDGPGEAVRAAALEGLARTEPAEALPLLRTALQSAQARVEGVAARELARLEGVALAKEMAGLAERGQVRIVAALADSGGMEVRPVLLEAASGASEAVRAVALSGLARVGTTADIPLLATRAASTGEEQAAARAALAGLRSDGADAAILQLLPSAEPKIKLELIRAMGGRGITSGSEALLAAAADADRTVRVESVRALRETAGTAQVPALVALLVKATADSERRECERTLTAAIRRSAEAPVGGVIEAYRAANAPAVRISLLNVLSGVGNSAALAVVRQALQDPAADVQRGALNALANWPTPDPLDDLLALARSSGDSTRPVLALRGYIKLAQLPSARAPAATAALLSTAIAVATRAEEKKSALAALQRVVCPESLSVARQSVGDPAVAAEARLAVETLERALSFVKQ